MENFESEENIALWQQQTSLEIPLGDINDAVYGHQLDDLINWSCSSNTSVATDNKFLIYINNCDPEAESVLMLAKSVAETRSAALDPWYYPDGKQYDTPLRETLEFYLNLAKEGCAQGGKYQGRYALQAVRCLMYMKRWGDVIAFADSAFAQTPNSDLMKRMSQRYVAGAWHHLGQTARGDSIFASVGDVWSIRGTDADQLMANINPNAPQLFESIRSASSSKYCMERAVEIAEQLVADKQVKHKGDWYFLMAYYAGEMAQRNNIAYAMIDKAMSHSFSTPEIADRANLYRIKLDGRRGNDTKLLNDIKWIESKLSPTMRDAKQWVRAGRNIAYTEIIPRLWQQGDYHTALLIAGWADNLEPHEGSPRKINPDYLSLTFQMMETLNINQLEQAFKQMQAPTSLYAHLRKSTCMNPDFYNELMGTKAIRNQDYEQAVKYLQRVSSHYLEGMNIYTEKYLDRDPFTPYPMAANVFKYDYPGSVPDTTVTITWTGERNAITTPDAKLRFANEMARLKHAAQHGNNGDERGHARLRYAIGLINQQENCWALSQYKLGGVSGEFSPILQYWEYEYAETTYGFLRKTDNSSLISAEQTFNNEVQAAIAMMETPEAKAQAHYLLKNLKTIIKHYPQTQTAAYIKTHCDNWRDWL